MTDELKISLTGAFVERWRLPGSAGDWTDEGFVLDVPYRVKLTDYYASLIQSPSAADPIARQCIPRREELETAPGEADPLGEAEAEPVPGLIHQYANRVLLMPTGRCALHCRHCNRRWRRKVGEDIVNDIVLARWIDYLKRHPDVNDVLVTGGDPLVLDHDLLDAMLARIRSVPTVETIRLGSRMPVVEPSRVTVDLARLLARHGPVYLHTQFNHPLECTSQAATALDNLAAAGLVLGNQMVMLRGVNDSVEAIVRVNRWLVTHRCRPYYIFATERIAGTSHFWVSLSATMELASSVRRMLSGIAMPQVVVDTPSGGGKVPLQPGMLRSVPGGVFVTDLWGREVFFPESDPRLGMPEPTGELPVL